MNEITLPIRIQRSRQKGWKNPPNTVYVGRPGKYGNPFKIAGEDGHWFVLGENDETLFTFDKKEDALAECLNCYERYLNFCLAIEPDYLDELKGKNLSCWCPDDNCHATILLRKVQERIKAEYDKYILF